MSYLTTLLNRETIREYCEMQFGTGSYPTYMGYCTWIGISYWHGKRAFKERNGITGRRVMDEIVAEKISSWAGGGGDLAFYLGVDHSSLIRMRKRLINEGLLSVIVE